MSSKAYIFLWTVFVGDISTFDIPTYMSSVKDSLGKMPELEERIGPIESIFLPSRTSPTSLEVIEFNSNPFVEMKKTTISRIKETTKEKILALLKEELNVTD